MAPMWLIAVVGTVAAVCTTAAFVPQIVKIWRQGGRDLSDGMLRLYLIGVVLWLAYGLLTGARAVIAANAVAMVLVAAALALKQARARTLPGERRRRRLRLAVDMDEVLADSLGGHLRAYNAAFGTRLTRADLEGHQLEAAVPEAQAEAARALLLDPAFFRDLDVIEGSQAALRVLAERYEVFVASAAMEVPSSFAAKYAWLREHFPFIPPSHIVFCGDKGVLDVDYLIDDTPRHFEWFRGTPILFSAPHNRRETRYRRAHGWDDIRRMLLGSSTASPA